MNLQDLLEEFDFTLLDIIVFTAIDTDALEEVLADLGVTHTGEELATMQEELYQEIKKRF